jgi:tRNA pseudouridine32 synthase / 23S rRNA pseudouridine746 synthase
MMNKPLMREGVRASVVALAGDEGHTLLDALCARFPHIPASQWASRFAAGDVLDEHGTPLAIDAPLTRALRVHYFRQIADEPVIPFAETILYQDAHLLVADKPHFLPVAPVGAYVRETLLTRLIARTGIDTLSPTHRLDKDTAGIVLFSVNPATRGAYQQLFRERAVTKVYEAIAPDLPDITFPLTIENRLEDDPAHFMQMRWVAGEPNAKTVIEKVRVFDGDIQLTCGADLAKSASKLAHYVLKPETGQRHQLRVHMAQLGAPIVNDGIYPALLAKSDVPQFDLPLKLLAKRVEFADPISGVTRSFESQFDLINVEK